MREVSVVHATIFGMAGVGLASIITAVLAGVVSAAGLALREYFKQRGPWMKEREVQQGETDRARIWAEVETTRCAMICNTPMPVEARLQLLDQSRIGRHLEPVPSNREETAPTDARAEAA